MKSIGDKDVHRQRGIRLLSVVLALALCAVGRTQEPESEKDKELARKRAELMEMRMARVRVTGSEADFPEQFETKPIFRYTDPARNYVAAAVWKLGAKGRPKALITTELHRQFYGMPRIVYEYLSLTPERFAVSGGDIAWRPEGTDLEFKPVPDSPAPDATPQRRLLQLKAIAKRFSGEELVGKENCELRLLPQPIDRYTPSTAERADGAIFLMQFGTNPEAVLFIESDGKAWNFAAGRLAGASKIHLAIDGKTAWEGAPVQYGATSPYTASNAPANIPGIAPDGSEILE